MPTYKCSLQASFSFNRTIAEMSKPVQISRINGVTSVQPKVRSKHKWDNMQIPNMLMVVVSNVSKKILSFHQSSIQLSTHSISTMLKTYTTQTRSECKMHNPQTGTMINIKLTFCFLLTNQPLSDMHNPSPQTTSTFQFSESIPFNLIDQC